MAGSRGHELVDFSDWLPTLAEIGGAKLDQETDGISFTTTLFHSGDHRARSFAFSEQRGGTAWVRTKQHKLYNDGRYFDIRADAMEQHPLKDITGRAAEERELLEAALLKLNYQSNSK